MIGIGIKYLTAEDTQEVHDFIARMADLNPNLCKRSMSSVAKIAEKERRGVIAIDESGRIVGFTALYDTTNPKHIESGSTCVDPKMHSSGIGSYMLALALVSFYTDSRNSDTITLGDVYAANPGALKMLLGLGFKIVDAPDWFVRARELKESLDQRGQETHCIAFNNGAIPPLLSKFPTLVDSIASLNLANPSTYKRLNVA